MTNTTGYTYFVIKTENEKVKLEDFNAKLSINPTDFKKIYEKGHVPKCTSWEISSGKLVNPYFYEEIEKIIIKLEKHKTELIQLKKENPEFVYQFIVVIFLGDESPGLHFSEKTINFLNDIGASIDCDIYNEK